MMQMRSVPYLVHTLVCNYLFNPRGKEPRVFIVLSPVLRCFTSRVSLNIRKCNLMTRAPSNRTGHYRGHKSPLKADARAGLRL